MDKVNQAFNSAYNDYLAKSKVAAQNPQAENPAVTPAINPTPPSIPSGDKNGLGDKVLKYSGLVSLFLVPAAAVISGKVVQSNMEKNFKAAQQTAAEQQEKLLNALNEALEAAQKAGTDAASKSDKNESLAWKAMAFIGSGAIGATVWDKINKGEKLTDEDKAAIQQGAHNNMGRLNGKADEVDGIKERVSMFDGLVTKYLKNTFGFKLLGNVEQRGSFNKTNYDKHLESIKDIASSYINGTAQLDKAPLSKGDTIWSVTSEFDPIKDGGLGSVPPEFQTNFEKLGVNVPSFVPMYEAKGTSRVVVDNNGKGTYEYGKTVFDIDKAVEFTMPAYRNGKVSNVKVEAFVSTHKKVNGKDVDMKPLIFIRNKDYFNNFIYAPGPNSEEPEKFAFFSKAVYELAKGKLDSKSVDDFKVVDNEAFNKFNAPDGMILNDWQAAPVSALMRYKTGCEAAAGTLNKDAANKLADMRLVSVCHNLMYQGSTQMNNDYYQKNISSENILNTLFDQYAHDIVLNAESGTPKETEEEKEQYHNISNVLVLEKDRGGRHVNFSNMAANLCDYFVPVSQNYADEVTEDGRQSGSLQWVMQQRAKSGVLKGITNGNDYKNVGLENVAGKMYDLTGVKLETYNANTPLEKILDDRAKNKINFYRNYVQKVADGTLAPEYAKGFENVGGTMPPELSDEELLNTPVLTNAGRLVSQKGIQQLCKTIQDLFENWEEKYPGQNKPIIYLAGSDGEGGTQRKFIEELKESLPAEDARRIIFYHGFAPIPAYMAASDYFLMPSQFEPCGLTQGESLGQSTPVIANATGGLVDTIVAEGDGQYGVLTEKGDVSQEGFAKAVDKGLDIYFNNKEKYNSMIKNASKCDFSWMQPNKQGPAYDYLELFGIKREAL